MAINETGINPLTRNTIGEWTTERLQKYLMDIIPRYAPQISVSSGDSSTGGTLEFLVDGTEYGIIDQLELLSGTGTTLTVDDLGGYVKVTIASSGSVPDNDYLDGMGYVAHTYRQILAQGTQANGAGQFVAAAVPIPPDSTITNIHCWIVTAGTGSSNTYAGIYNLSGTKLAETGNESTAFNSTGLKTLALTSPYSISTKGLYYVGWTHDATVTRAAWAGNEDDRAVVAGPAGVFPTINHGSGLTSLPASLTPTAATNSTSVWVALS